MRNPSGWAPPVAETRADDRAHGVGRSPAHSSFKGAGPETHDALRSQKTVNSKGDDAELLSQFEEELGGTWFDRLSDVRPQERVQWHTVEHLTHLVRFAPKVQVLNAPAPLVVEQLVDVLALVEKKEREEDARILRRRSSQGSQ